MRCLKYSRLLNLAKMALLIPVTLSVLQGCAAVVASSAATGVAVSQDRRTTGTIVDDKGLELKAVQSIHNALTQDEQNTNVSVISYNNRVLLIGQAPSNEVRSRVEAAVKDVAKFKQLHNEIVIATPTSLMTRSADSVITTKIKSAMLLNRDLNPARVKVITEDSVVYLLGIVTPEEEEIAVDIARNTKGVAKVVKIFEYQNP
ncbi:BON domain-containing protein [Candidatus Berkiella cookevillensis]|uniref:BON domain-containing protein n=1 Tax=Candidatus Berkiella cookevillensis TaxID=437022 RepID=A0A0Q9YN72_9GAMM|nr:BON domain-containing protein [Candidatus Berkiella cookevillensis]MCS5709164.1 BON domain-containing protein [Candidatus Berkiella cookevillensis]